MSHNSSPQAMGAPGDDENRPGQWNPALRPDTDEEYPPSSTSATLSKVELSDPSADVASSSNPLPSDHATPIPSSPFALWFDTPSSHEPGLSSEQSFVRNTALDQAREVEKEPGSFQQRERNSPGERENAFFTRSGERRAVSQPSSSEQGHGLARRTPETSTVSSSGPLSSFSLPWIKPSDRRLGYDEDELSSDEDDERLDPAWGIKRIDTSQLLAKAKRSSSFPDFSVDANSMRQGQYETRLPTTEVESIIQEIEAEPKDPLPVVTISSPVADIPGKSFDDGYHGETFEDREASFIDNVPTTNGPPQIPGDAEARFEEGMPLVAARFESEDKEVALEGNDSWSGPSVQALQDGHRDSLSKHPIFDTQEASSAVRDEAGSSVLDYTAIDPKGQNNPFERETDMSSEHNVVRLKEETEEEAETSFFSQNVDDAEEETRSFRNEADESFSDHAAIDAKGETKYFEDDPEVSFFDRTVVDPGAETKPFYEEAEVSFFDHHRPDADEAESRPQFDRKPTSEVLGTLHFSSDDPPDSPDPFFQDRSPLPGQNQAEEIQLPEHNTEEIAPKLEEQNISALWQAALDDDDLLLEDADELLPESLPDSPSSFLESLMNEDSSFAELDQAPRDTSSSSNGPAPASNYSRTTSSIQQAVNLYAPHQPSTSDLTELSSGAYGNVGLRQQMLPPQALNTAFPQQDQRPAPPQQALSFADRSKDGYRSPYDLPLEISKPRKRAPVQQPPQSSKLPPPPPRSSSMNSDKPPIPNTGRLQSPFSPTNTQFPSFGRTVSAQGPPPSSTMSPPAPKASEPSSRPKPGSSSSFFEELPIVSRSRAPTVPDRYTPQQNGAIPPPQLLPRSPPAQNLPPQAQPQIQSPPTIPLQQPSDPYAQYQLQRPERIDPYAHVPLQPPPAPPATSSRYSPVPPSTQAGSRPTSTRYSPAPPPQNNNIQPDHRYTSQPAVAPLPPVPPPPPVSSIQPQNRFASQPSSVPSPIANILAFQPRTSSPLALRRTSVEEPFMHPSSMNRSTPSSPQNQRSQYQPQQPNKSYPSGIYAPSSQPQPHSTSATVDNSAEYMNTARSYVPPIPGAGIPPPRRSQTQSPGRQLPLSSSQLPATEPIQRPVSVQDHAFTTQPSNPMNSFPPPRTSVRQRGLSQNLTFIQPTDELQQDELQRWKGSPIFHFGFGGSIITSFPKHIPRYSAGLTMPMIKPTAGEVQVRSAKEILPSSEHFARFPGPLRSKSKKKEVLSWLSERISAFEATASAHHNNQQLPDPYKRFEEKILLWKTVAAIVEHDGATERSPDVLKSINSILSPELFNLDESTATQYILGSDVTGIYRPAGSTSRADPVDPAAVETIRKNLLRGEREKAVWNAVDNRLWAHAMLISSTLDKTVWKQVVQEFVRQEVKIIGANTESLAALYEIFAGNLEESIDELVPPSARAGLQMISKVESAGPVKNALDGLDRWRETLELVLNNHSPEDNQALAALGRLLSSYGRVEASHLCFLFARSAMQSTIFGGADDAQASVVLLGADHRNQPFDFFRDEDAMLLTEIYEFATSVLASSSSSAPMPHLQVYKLQRASMLAEAGFKSESQAYCDAIAGSLKSTTKISPYYNPQFFAQLDELTRRLQQAPAETSSSWISKPSMGKVSGSVWNKFSSFVAGDDSDGASTGSGKDANHEQGPFAKVTATPALSRSGSASDLYGPYNPSTAQPLPNTVAASRYAPSGQFTARSSLELQGQNFPDSQKASPYAPTSQGQRHGSYDANSYHDQQPYVSLQPPNSYQPAAQITSANRYQATPPPTSYVPTAQPEEQMRPTYTPQGFESHVPNAASENVQPLSYAPHAPSAPDAYLQQDSSPSFGGYTPSPQPVDNNLSSPIAPSDEPSSQPAPYSFSYEPPEDSGYVPYQPDPESDSESDSKKAKPPKKKSFMEDDDDNFTRPSKPSQVAAPPPAAPSPDHSTEALAKKRANDAAAEAAFKAAAEADAARDKDSKTLKAKPSGWLGGWFRGGKPEGLDSNPSASSGKAVDAKVIRAKLGEESSFYYDKELKKWVNKKDPNSMQAGARATPPPPRGPASRTVSAAGGPPPPPGGRNWTPNTSTLAPENSHAGLFAPSPRIGMASGPSSRAATPTDISGGENSRPPTSDEPARPPVASLLGPSSTSLFPSGTSSAPPSSPAPPSGAPTPPIGGPPSRPATAASNFNNPAASSIDDLLGGPAGAAGGRRTVKGKKGAKGRYIDVMAK